MLEYPLIYLLTCANCSGCALIENGVGVTHDACMVDGTYVFQCNDIGMFPVSEQYLYLLLWVTLPLIHNLNKHENNKYYSLNHVF